MPSYGAVAAETGTHTLSRLHTCLHAHSHVQRDTHVSRHVHHTYTRLHTRAFYLDKTEEQGIREGGRRKLHGAPIPGAQTAFSNGD